MERIVHSLVQGTPAWDEFRLTHFGASEIAAVLGMSKKTTRTELLRAKKTGIAKEFSAWLRDNVLDRGHEIEALARPLAVQYSDVDGFYPVTVSIGRISASSDGIDMLDETAWECKTLNAQNGPIVRAGQVPEEHMPQCQQVLMVTGADRLLFTVSDGTRENTFHTWVEPDTAWFDRIRAAWAQFEIDLETHEPVEATISPTGRTMEALPALRIEVTGAVTASNLAAFKDHALTIFGGINRILTTDQEFADAEKAVKWCGEVEDRLAAAKQHALSQTESIDALFRTIEEISGEARRVRLDLDKLVKARKEQIRVEIVREGTDALAKHVEGLNARLGKPYMPQQFGDFAAAIKGRRTVDSMRDAVSTTLANAKIAASAIADKIQTNLATLREQAAEHAFLFPDTQIIVQKAPDDLATLAKSRIAEHQEKERQREEAQRARIAEEERVKAEAKVRAEEEQKRRDEAAAAASAQAAQVVQQAAATPPPAPAAAAPVAPVRAAPPAAAAAAPTADTAPTLSLGTIKTRIAPIQITADGLTQLGFTGVKERGSVLYHEHQYPQICAALIAHLEAALEAQPA